MNFFDGLGINSQLISMILVYVIIFGGMYLIMVRPQQKRRKQEEELKKSLQLGDEITTIGGIVGRIINIKDDTDSLIIESGSNKIRIKKWAVSSVEYFSSYLNIIYRTIYLFCCKYLCGIFLRRCNNQWLKNQPEIKIIQRIS